MTSVFTGERDNIADMLHLLFLLDAVSGLVALTTRMHSQIQTPGQTSLAEVPPILESRTPLACHHPPTENELSFGVAEICVFLFLEGLRLKSLIHRACATSADSLRNS